MGRAMGRASLEDLVIGDDAEIEAVLPVKRLVRVPVLAGGDDQYQNGPPRLTRFRLFLACG